MDSRLSGTARSAIQQFLNEEQDEETVQKVLSKVSDILINKRLHPTAAGPGEESEQVAAAAEMRYVGRRTGTYESTG